MRDLRETKLRLQEVSSRFESMGETGQPGVGKRSVRGPLCVQSGQPSEEQTFCVGEHDGVSLQCASLLPSER